MDLGLIGKVALVTGSSRGIGRGIATRLVEEGADVVFCARGAEALDAAVSGARRAWAGARRRRRRHEPEEARRRGRRRPSRRSAGSTSSSTTSAARARGRSTRSTTPDLDDVLGRNLVPALAVSPRGAAGAARARGRRDRDRSRRSGGARRGQPELQRRQGGRDQPGEGDGGRPREGPDPRVQRRARLDALPRRQLGAARADDPEGMAAFVERELPWGRFGTVDEIADVVTFLVSPRASWVVGTCVSSTAASPAPSDRGRPARAPARYAYEVAPGR